MPKLNENQFISPSNTIGAIIRGFKSSATKEIRMIYDLPYKKIWHRNYYDVIIRNKYHYEKVSKYIENNPKKWKY